mgnify:CR=1 FL=1
MVPKYNIYNFLKCCGVLVTDNIDDAIDKTSYNSNFTLKLRFVDLDMDAMHIILKRFKWLAQ